MNGLLFGREYTLTFAAAAGTKMVQRVLYIGRGYYLPVVDKIIESKDGKFLFEDIDIGGRSLVDWELEEAQIISYKEIE